MERIYNFLYTGVLYTIIVGLTVFFSKKAGKAKNKNKFIFFSLLTLCIPSLFASLRSLNVGTDIMVYAYPQFQRAEYYTSFSDYYNTSGFELGYSLITFISAHWFGSIQCLLFLTAFLQVLPVYIGAVKVKELIPVEKVLLVYMLLFYIVGFNIMRQGIAAGWIFLALIYTYKDSYLKAAISCFIAIMFHGTAIFGILTLGLFIIFKYIKKRKWLLFWSVVFFIIVVSLAKYWVQIIYLMGTWNLLPYEKVVGYSMLFSGGDSIYTTLVMSHYIEAFFKVLLLFVCFTLRDKTEDKLYMSTFGTYLMGVLLYMFFFIGFHTSFGYRVSLFAEYSLLVLIPLADSTNRRQIVRKTTTTITIKELLVWGTAILNFIILFVLLGTHGTYPFRFIFE